jgi:hypothetical protein
VNEDIGAPVDENTSDGYHTFRELYDHRIALFIALMRSHSDISWAAHQHDDGTSMPGWLIAGLDLPTGPITYHLPVSAWKDLGGIPTYLKAPPWDGHTQADVVDRLTRWYPQSGRDVES